VTCSSPFWIALTGSFGACVLLDERDAARVLSFRSSWSGSREGYARWSSKLMHRLIIGAKPGELVDHINGDKLDNRASNLRIVTRRQNAMNSRASRNIRAGKRKGVRWDKDRGLWNAGIVINGRRKFLGRFQTEDEGARAYDAAAREHFGEFAALNFPESQ